MEKWDNFASNHQKFADSQLKTSVFHNGQLQLGRTFRRRCSRGTKILSLNGFDFFGTIRCAAACTYRNHSDSRGTKGCAMGVPKQDRWVTNLHRAMLFAIGQQLKAEHDLPNELTPKLGALLSAIDSQKDKPE